MKKTVVISSTIFLITFLASFLTLDDIGICWDEPVYLEAAKYHSRWFSILFQKGIKYSFSKSTIKKYWHFNLEHPQFSKILIGISYVCFNKILGDINSARILSVLLYSGTCVLLFLFILKFYGMKPAIFSSSFLFFLPRYFGHSHIISLDIQTSFFTLLCVVVFVLGIENRKWAVMYGILQGCAISIRTSLLFMPFLLVLWGYIFYREKIRWNFYSFFILSPIVYFITNPYLWHDFYYHLYKFIDVTISRANWNRVPLYYLGKQYVWEYPYKEPIYYPWHYPYVIIAVSTPAIVLVSFFAGVYNALKNRIGILIVLNFLFPLLIFTPTNVPKYDGERLFLQSYIFLCAIASFGFINILKLADRISIYFKRFVVFVVFLILFLPFYWIRPFYLEYYNEIIGGVKGAHKRGFETTYFGGVINKKFINDLNKTLPKNSNVLLSPYSNFTVEFYKKRKILREDIYAAGITLPCSGKFFSSFDKIYLVLLARQGCFTKELWKIYKKTTPIYTVSLDGVPIVMVYKLK